ncbi:translocation/assembly module TamB domain-containing protein [Flavisphingomonas formosensis]|uniref:translocation/assembly module TamB domain-containing protein n=1 Tax=Flavisphingomonas formosensis TaxID=861534 RepID=UPI0012FBCF6B|nr:translocation/assembly module TamB domain-containing protein [Sphingomonas formosensis]
MAEEETIVRERPALGWRIAKWTGLVVAALLAFLLLFVLFLNTGPGRAFLARQIAAYETQSGISVHIRRIDGSIYDRMELIGLSVNDTKGAFLTSDHVTLDWRPFAYLGKKLDVRALLSPEVRLLRNPALKPVPPEPNAPILPDLDIAIGRLKVDRLVMEPPVTGKRHILSLAGSADIAGGRARIDADAHAIAAPGIAGGDAVVVKLDAVPDQNRLLIDATIDAPVGGVVDSYAKLGKPLAFTIKGNGDWKNWNGRLAGRLGGASLADLSVIGKDGRFLIKGDVVPGLMLTGPGARLTEPAITIDLDATLGKRKADLKLAAHSSALAMTAAGLVDLGENRFGNLAIDAQLLTPGAIAENVRGKDVRFAAMLDGPFATPTIAYKLSAAAIGFGNTGIEGLAASGRATIDAKRILIPVNATAKRVTGLNAAAGGLLANLSVNGDLAYSDGRLMSDNLHLRSSQIDATALILADMNTGRYTGAIKGRINDYHVDGLGRIALTTDARLVPGKKGGFGIQGAFKVATRSLDNATVRDTLGGNAVTTARFGFDENGIASLQGLRMTAPAFRVTDGGGSFNTATGQIAFRASAVSRQYGPLAVTASGTLEKPVVLLKAPRPYVGVQLSSVEAELRGVPQGYSVKAKGGSPYGPFAANVLIHSGKGPLAIDVASARFAGIDFAGKLVQTAAGPFGGTLTLSGSGFNGAVKLSAAGANQRADVDVKAQAAKIPGEVPITIGSGVIQATAILYPNAPSVTGAFRFADIRQGDTLIGRAQGRIDYRSGRGTLAMTAAGESGVPFDVAMQAALSPDRIVANVKGNANGIAFHLAQPAVATKAGKDWNLQPVMLVVPQGRMQISGRYGATTDIHARLDNMSMAVVAMVKPGLGIDGRASGTIDYSTKPGAEVPTLRARLDIAHLTRTSSFVVSEPVDVAMLGTLDGSGGDIRALIRRGGATVGRMQLRLAPLGSGAGLAQRLFGAPLSGGIRYNGPADVLWTATGIARQNVTGPIAVAADFGGTLSEPTLNGVMRANGLRYENEIYGTVISNIVLEGRFTQSRLEIPSFSGRAGTGTISGRGTVSLDAAQGYPLSLAVTLDKAQLAKSDALGATVSGTLSVTNSKADGALIKGDLRVPSARYQIVRQGAAEVAELEGVRRKGQQGVAAAAAATPPPSRWQLDIRIRAANQIFVSGMGLEAEFATDMRITGTATKPVVVGKLSVVRGTYSFAGRRFDLDDNGDIQFDGPLLDPELDISASTTVEGVSATINIGGHAQHPQISFTSTPSLPQDEILSRLLFGSSVTSLSPTQAIQLAAALNSLRGSGGGLNPLGKLRSAVGIDRLRVLGEDKNAGRGTSLAAGKYISKNVYVEVITDARGFTATQLEISLSKALSVLSQTGSFGGSSVNIRYSKDY